MSTLDFNGLMKLPTKERSKLTKTELLDAIERYSFYYKNNIAEKESAQQALVTQATEEKAVKALLIGYLDVPTEQDSQYGGKEKIEYTLLDLVGKLLATNK